MNDQARTAAVLKPTLSTASAQRVATQLLTWSLVRCSFVACLTGTEFEEYLSEPSEPRR